MRRILGHTAAAMGVLSLCALTASAQQGATRMELGMDAALTRISSSASGSGTTALEIPVQAFRFGFELSPAVMLEPTLGYRGAFGSGSATDLTFDAGLPITLSNPPGASQVFVRPLIGVRYFSSDNDSEHQLRLGGGVGLRVPIVPHLMSRFEARYTRDFKSSNLPSFNEFALLAGLSFFPR